jgi:hypothetical protein
MTFAAEADLGTYTCDGFTERVHFGDILPEQVQDEAQRGFLPDAREPRECLHGIFQKLRRKLHTIKVLIVYCS